jgi:hypothetical protein
MKITELQAVCKAIVKGKFTPGLAPVGKFFYLNAMILIRQLKVIATCIVVVFFVFFMTAVFDILMSALSPRFYSVAGYLCIFSLGGIFASVQAYTYGMDISDEQDGMARWTTISAIIIIALLFFFYLSHVEANAYQFAFKAFGATLGPVCLLYSKVKKEPKPTRPVDLNS